LLAFEPEGRGTNVAEATDYLSKMLHHKSVIFLVSDFMDEGIEHPLKLLAQRHDVIAVTVGDPSEIDLPNVGLARFVDPETGLTIDVDTSDPTVREQFLKTVTGDSDRRRRLLRRLAIDEIPVSTDQSIMDPLLKFFRTRETKARRR
jgi:uncharacterized protein (DUF58 family)